MLTASLIAALAIGFSSSAHCIFMCGGIAAAFSQKSRPDNLDGKSKHLIATTGDLPERQHEKNLQTLSCVALFHLGRLCSYAGIGWVAGTLASESETLMQLGPWMRLIAGLLLLAMGLYLSNLWRGLSHIEQLMQPIWKPVAQIVARMVPFKRRRDALFVGALWGWLPCGVIYSALAWATVTGGGGVETATLMFFVGIGTIPALMGISFYSSLARSKASRQVAGIALCAFGLWTMISPLTQILNDEAADHSMHQSAARLTMPIAVGSKDRPDADKPKVLNDDWLVSNFGGDVCGEFSSNFVEARDRANVSKEQRESALNKTSHPIGKASSPIFINYSITQ